MVLTQETEKEGIKQELVLSLLDYLQITVGFEGLKDTQRVRLANCSKLTDYFYCGCKVVGKPHRCNYYRLCDTCGEINLKKNKIKYRRVLETFPIITNPREVHRYGLRLLTLTIINQDNLKEGIKKLKSWFRKFRHRKYIKEKITAGLVSYEVTYSTDNKTGKYHIHLHSIICSTYISMKHQNGENSPLVNNWVSVTNGEGRIAYIELCRDYQGGLSYLLKYVCKPNVNLSMSEKTEIFLEFFHQKLVYCFGKIPKINVIRMICFECGLPYKYLSPNSEEYNLIFPDKIKPPDDLILYQIIEK